METNYGLNLTNGTSTPTDTTLAIQGLDLTGLGSGPYGSYTMSDFFGCMSGLPYPWAEILYQINNLETRKLYNIYNQLFLAVTWEPAKFTISQVYGYEITKPYVAPTTAANPPNPNFNLDGSTYTAGSFIIGAAYDIVSLGTTNFTLIGASSNTVGVRFQATGVGTGTGTAKRVVDSNQYINGATGIATNSSRYYNFAGSPELYSWWYEVRIHYNNDDGGGYYRGTAPDPTLTIYPNKVNARVTFNIGKADTDAGSVGQGTFGRLINVAINNGGRYTWLARDVQPNWNNSILVGQNITGAPAPTVPVYPPRDAIWVQANMPYERISIQHPPTATLAVLENGDISQAGVNTPGDVYDRDGRYSVGTGGWQAPMNTVTQGYINQANQEIEALSVNTKTRLKVIQLQILADQCGQQLTREQRSRFIGLPPVPIPRDPWINIYPTTLYVFTDNLPTYAQNTLPHMHVQTLEAISNLDTIGGQSIVGAMRTERNQARLAKVGIQLDNNIPSDLAGISVANTTALVLNGTAPVALPTNGIVNITTGENFTLPAWVTNYDAAGNLIYPKSPFVYSTNTGVTIATGSFVGGSTVTLLSGNSNISIVGTAVPTGPYTSPVNTFTIDRVDRGGGTSTNADLLNCKVDTGPNTNNSNLVVLTLKSGKKLFLSLDNITNVQKVVSNAILNGETGNEEIHVCEIILSTTVPPTQLPPIGGTFISTTPVALGSFAYANPALPINLDGTYISGALLPSTPNITEAIANVIECNCDCWVT